MTPPSDVVAIRIDDLERAVGVLLEHVRAIEGDVVHVPDYMYWHIQRDERQNVMEVPQNLTIGQLSETLDKLMSVAPPDDALAFGLVWLADVLRAVGEQTVG